MNRRSFLALVATAPLVAALKPWRPQTVTLYGFKFEADPNPTSYSYATMPADVISVGGRFTAIHMQSGDYVRRGAINVPVKAGDVLRFVVDRGGWPRLSVNGVIHP